MLSNINESLFEKEQLYEVFSIHTKMPYNKDTVLPNKLDLLNTRENMLINKIKWKFGWISFRIK